MILKCSDFINEAKVTELKVGDRVMFHGKFSIGMYGDKLDLDGKTGVIMKIKKERYMSVFNILLDEPFKSAYIKKNTVNLSSYQVRYLTVIEDKELTEEEKEYKRKLESGEITKYLTTKIFADILRATKFKRKGDYFDATYFDIVENKPDYISYVPSKKSKSADFEKARQETRVGRVLRKLNPDLKDAEIEEFVNRWRAEYEIYFKKTNVEVVNGRDISYWYNVENYKEGSGTLNKSCMRRSSAVNFYTHFPDRIAMAILTKDGKLLGRALIWKLDNGGIYMDRIYSVTPTIAAQIRRYGLVNKMIMRDNNKKTLTVTLKSNIDYMNKLPFRDTFYYYYYNKKTKTIVLSNVPIKD